MLIIVLEATSQDLWDGLPIEKLYADDLVLIAQDEKTAQELFGKSWDGMGSQGLKVHSNTTRVMILRPRGIL